MNQYANYAESILKAKLYVIQTLGEVDWFHCSAIDRTVSEPGLKVFVDPANVFDAKVKLPEYFDGVALRVVSGEDK